MPTDNLRREKILPPPNADIECENRCLACYFTKLADQGSEVAPACLSFAHTCGKGDPPDEQELERINEAARELLRREQIRIAEAEKVVQSKTTDVPSKVEKKECACAKDSSKVCDPFKNQVGGEHYLGFKIQPAYFCIINNLTAAESHVIKYVCRWRNKGGIRDLEKARHWLEMLIECNKNGAI
jgi:hypothetical protein